jgi:hypothetical protein
MISVIGSSKVEPLLVSLGAKIVGGKWSLTSLPNDARIHLEESGATVEGAKYSCWNTWFPNIYQVTKDSRCTVAFNTLAKRAVGRVFLDDVITGRAKPKPSLPKRLHGSYRVEFQGKFYPSESALARAFGINPVKFHSRRQLGWTIEESLE